MCQRVILSNDRTKIVVKYKKAVMMRFLFLGLCVLLSTACEKSVESPENFSLDSSGGWLGIEIKLKANPDCHVPEIVFLTNPEKAYAILNDNSGRYLATGLPDSADVGDRYYVEIVRPLPANYVACTSMGPAPYTQAHVIQIRQ
jgi:hypothetical protein